MATELEHSAMAILANALPVIEDAENRGTAWAKEAAEVRQAIERWMETYHAEMAAK